MSDCAPLLCRLFFRVNTDSSARSESLGKEKEMEWNTLCKEWEAGTLNLKM